MKTEKRYIKVKVTKTIYEKIKKLPKQEQDKIVNEALAMYFNKSFCIRESERNAILGLGLLDK